MSQPQRTLSLEEVYHYYGDQCVLKNVTFHATPGKITAVLGKSGSGKSTLLQVINGMIRPAKGKVFFLGNSFDYSNAELLRCRMGYAVQGVGLFPHYTVEENILIARRIQQKSPMPSNERLEILMTKMNLPLSYKKKYPHELSGGEQQRVGICRALFHDPPVLLMDEPLGALDSITQEDILQEILSLQQTEPRTVILVTHNPYEALTLADDILILDDGKVLQHGRKQNVLNNPADELVERLTRIKAI